MCLILSEHYPQCVKIKDILQVCRILASSNQAIVMISQAHGDESIVIGESSYIYFSKYVSIISYDGTKHS